LEGVLEGLALKHQKQIPLNPPFPKGEEPVGALGIGAVGLFLPLEKAKDRQKRSRLGGICLEAKNQIPLNPPFPKGEDNQCHSFFLTLA
jgi:hypothetical protein